MGDTPATHVSTGHLPASAVVADLVAQAHQAFAHVDDGTPSSVYPALAAVDPDLFSICVVGVQGNVHEVGDSDVEFPIMSVAKPFVFALVCDAVGPDRVAAHVGVNATGRRFNSVEAIERGVGGRTNPMVNAGAIATTSMVVGATQAHRWEVVRRGLSAFAGRELAVDAEVEQSARATNHRNRAIAQLVDAHGGLLLEPAEALELYTRQSCLAVTARDLAVMGATLADGGVNPITRQRVVGATASRHALAVMATAGMYEATGDWMYRIGLPGKSGIGGGIVTCSPGKGGLGVFSPPLDQAGNSVRGQLVAAHLARALGLDIFVSQEVPS